ncbi:MAG: L-threonylcarbamoyladenylate synthase [Patescibacteria group bacterium]|nr:L-threonylcarbamoyladenylate synthase [Patescibacteria group bacterium]
MQQIKLYINNRNNLNEILNNATRILQNGGVIIYPTDTLYGIGVNALNKNAIEKIFKIKKRDKNKPISIIVKDIKSAKKIAYIDSKVERILNKAWPGPITIILRKKDVLPYILTAGNETIAIRIPDNKFVSALIKNIDFPLTTTSANISGEENLYEVKKIIEKFNKNEIKPDLFINAGNVKNSIPSTIIDLTNTIPKIVRMGVVGKNMMQEIFNKFI